MTAELGPPGFFGKLPSNGDFINRRVSRGFLETWDEWLQSCVAASKAALGEDWLETYLTSPIWNFVLPAGLCGRKAYAGVLMPSVDQVGRYFPMMITTAVPDSVSPLRIAVVSADWFVRAGDVALSALEDEAFSLDDFDTAVEALGPAVSVEAELSLDTFELSLPDAGGLCVPLDTLNGVAASIAQLADGFLTPHWNRYSTWWTDGSDYVAPCVLIAPGLPEPDAYTGLLDGQWSAGHWTTIGAQPAAGEAPESAPE